MATKTQSQTEAQRNQIPPKIRKFACDVEASDVYKTDRGMVRVRDPDIVSVKNIPDHDGGVTISTDRDGAIDFHDC